MISKIDKFQKFNIILYKLLISYQRQQRINLSINNNIYSKSMINYILIIQFWFRIFIFTIVVKKIICEILSFFGFFLLNFVFDFFDIYVLSNFFQIFRINGHKWFIDFFIQNLFTQKKFSYLIIIKLQQNLIVIL